ncbi:MAG TPA: hypothetical protein VMK12_08320 [Anaeromyxobacteraceae bacterium]|nr:hypothetical protein [Anaeromyxobacteraceae bacterium]
MRDILRAPRQEAPLPVIVAPLCAVARGALVAAQQAGAVVGLALPSGSAPEAWFEAVATAADELAPRLPFFLSARVRVEGNDQGLVRARAVAHRLVEAGITHLAVDVTDVPLAKRAQAVGQVADLAAERELAVDCVIPTDCAGNPEAAAAFLEEFEGWGIRADMVSARLQASATSMEAREQLASLAALSKALDNRPVLRRGPLSAAFLSLLPGEMVACEDGGMAIAAGLRALPASLRGRDGHGRREPFALPDELAERVEAFAYGEVASFIEKLGSVGSAARLEAALATTSA